MEHVGLDLGAKRTHVVRIAANGQVIERLQVPTKDLPGWLKTLPPSRVVMEACTQSPAIARASQAAKHETIVVPGQLVRALGVGARGIKTDDRDAEVLARASLRNEVLPSVHLRTEIARSRKQLVSARAVLVKSRVQISLYIKTWLRGQLLNIESRASSRGFPDAVRRLALDQPEGLPMEIVVLLTSYESLTEQIDKLDEELERVAEQDENSKLLMTMPGIGPIAATMFAAHVDDVSRFESGEQLASYLGLVPGEATTGGKVVRTSMIKAGPKQLRSQMVQSAWTLRRSRPNDPIVVWARRIEEKRGKQIAIVALARKMTKVLYAMWKAQKPYDAARASEARASAAG